MKKLITIIIAVCFMFTLAGPCMAKNVKAKGPSDTAVEKANDNASFKRDDKTGKCTDLLGKEIACPDKDKKDKGEKDKDNLVPDTDKGKGKKK